LKVGVSFRINSADHPSKLCCIYLPWNLQFYIQSREMTRLCPRVSILRVWESNNCEVNSANQHLAGRSTRQTIKPGATNGSEKSR